MRVKKQTTGNIQIGGYCMGLIILSIIGAKNDFSDWKLNAPYSLNHFIIHSDSIPESKPWIMHLIDPNPPSGSDGVKLADVNRDGLEDLVTGFEEDGVSRIYIHPGPDKVMDSWKFVELPSPDVEDAVLVDLDDDGNIDLVTASEGNTNKILFHWAPKSPEGYLQSEQWTTEIVTAVEDLSAWMFVVPVDMDGQNGVDLIVGSKRKRGVKGQDKAVVGWLQSPENPRNIENWKFHPLTTAGWIMSMEVADMNDDGRPDILISDRKNSTGTGVRWLENPGRSSDEFYHQWKSYRIGLDQGEPMFLSRADLDGDRVKEIVVPDMNKGLVILREQVNPASPWKENIILYPDWAGSRGKAVTTGDIDLDGKIDLVLSFEEEGKVASIPFEKYKSEGKYSVIWGAYQNNPYSGFWNFSKVSGLQGRKFDLVNLIDIDGDGDLDVLTNDENEEDIGLGVVWYENPIRFNE